MPKDKSGMELKCICPECKSEFHTVAREVLEGEEGISGLESGWFNVNGKAYKLTWYDCPSCGLRIYVQCDDQKTEQKLKKCMGVIAAMNDKRTHRFDNHRKQSEHLAKLRADLAETRKRLEKAVSGAEIIDRHNGTSHVVRFYHE